MFLCFCDYSYRNASIGSNFYSLSIPLEGKERARERIG